MKILCLGHASYDIIMPVPNYPVENFKYRITNKVECGGGPASNAAYLLGKWGMDSSFAGVVGYDTYGNKIKREFEAVHVNMKLLQTNYEKSTTTSFIIINEATGKRTVFNIADEYFKMQKYKIEQPFDVLLFDGHDLEASKYALEKCPNAISIIDAGRATEEVIELCNHVKYIVCSKEFAENVTNQKFDFSEPKTIASIYLALKDKFKKSVIVITLEEKGSLYKINDSIKLMPIIKVNVKDTTGVGDIYHGAFAYGIANNFDLEKTIKIATIAAGLSAQYIGARYSIPELDEVIKYYESHK